MGSSIVDIIHYMVPLAYIRKISVVKNVLINFVNNTFNLLDYEHAKLNMNTVILPTRTCNVSIFTT